MKIQEVTYDPRARAGYVYFSDKPVAKTVQNSDFINLDLDRKGGLALRHLVGNTAFAAADGTQVLMGVDAGRVAVAPADGHRVSPHRLDLGRLHPGRGRGGLAAEGAGTGGAQKLPRVEAFVPVPPDDLERLIAELLDPGRLDRGCRHAIIPSVTPPPAFGPKGRPSEPASGGQAGGGVKTGFYFQDLPRAALSVGGKDRVIFLHRLLSNDIKGLQPGQGKPACLLDRQGKILFSCTAHALAQEILLEMDPTSLPGARAALERYVVSDAVQFSDATGRFRVFSAYGPAAAALKASPPPGGFLARSPWVGMPGLDLWLPAEDSQAATGFIESAQAAGMEEGTAKMFEALRIEAGLPWPGHEITSDVILNELGREEFVSFTKGCYIGQEIVARIKHRAHPPRLLTGFFLDGNEIPLGGSVIESESQEVGVITSACFSTTFGKPIALGFLKFGVEPSQVIVQTPGGPISARPIHLPFVKT